MTEAPPAPPTCAGCVRFTAGARMLDPKLGKAVQTGTCDRDGFRIATESCWKHEPRQPVAVAVAAE